MGAPRRSRCRLLARGACRRRREDAHLVADADPACDRHLAEHAEVDLVLRIVGAEAAVAEDRARLAASVERAVVGLVLWDELDEKDLATLIGRWAPFVDGEG